MPQAVLLFVPQMNCLSMGFSYDWEYCIRKGGCMFTSVFCIIQESLEAH